MNYMNYELYSPSYLAEHLARRACCPPRRVWLILYQLYFISEQDITAEPLTRDEAAQVEHILWQQLNEDLETENLPSFLPRRPIGQRIFTPALTASLPHNLANNPHKIADNMLAFSSAFVHNKLNHINQYKGSDSYDVPVYDTE